MHFNSGKMHDIIYIYAFCHWNAGFIAYDNFTILKNVEAWHACPFQWLSICLCCNKWCFSSPVLIAYIRVKAGLKSFLFFRKENVDNNKTKILTWALIEGDSRLAAWNQYLVKSLDTWWGLIKLYRDGLWRKFEDLSIMNLLTVAAQPLS